MVDREGSGGPDGQKRILGGVLRVGIESGHCFRIVKSREPVIVKALGRSVRQSRERLEGRVCICEARGDRAGSLGRSCDRWRQAC